MSALTTITSPNPENRDAHLARQRAILRDPHAFAAAMEDRVFGAAEIDALFSESSASAALARQLGAAFDRARLATATPDGDPTIALARADDLANDLATVATAEIGIAKGIVLEQLRQAMLRCLDAIGHPDSPARLTA